MVKHNSAQSALRATPHSFRDASFSPISFFDGPDEPAKHRNPQKIAAAERGVLWFISTLLFRRTLNPR
jgi:hypothetical protein